MFFYHPKLVRVFFHLNNSLNNKWFNFKIPFWNICTITPFPTCSLMGHLKFIMPEFYYVIAKGMHLASNLTNLPNLLIIFPNFLHNTSYMTWTTPSLILHYVCTHPINLMGIHLLHCVHGNEQTKTHDAIYNTFVVITWDVGFHMEQELLHALLSTTFNSFH